MLQRRFQNITTSQENFTQHLPHQRNKTGELKETLKEEVELENTIVPKAKYNAITRLKESRELLE